MKNFILVMDFYDNDYCNGMDAFCRHLIDMATRDDVALIFERGTAQTILSQEFALQCLVAMEGWDCPPLDKLSKYTDYCHLSVQWLDNYPMDGKEPSIRAIVDFHNKKYDVLTS